MLRKKILKILSVLVAVIIAFSCFLLPCSAESIPSIDGFELQSFDFFVLCTIFDSSGEVVDEIVISPDTYSFNVSGDSLYIDASDSKLSILTKPGYMCAFYISWSYPDNLSDKLVYFTFPKSYQFLEFLENDNFNIDYCYSSNSPNCYFTSTYYNSSFSCILMATENSKYFPLVITVSDNPWNDSSFDAPKVFPGVFKFYSDMRSIMDFSLNGLFSLFSKVRSVAPLLVLFLGFSIVGFIFAIHRRLFKG